MAESFGEALRRRRESAGLPQPQLARRVPISQASLSRYERGLQAVDPSIADRLDDILKAGGSLRALLPTDAVGSALRFVTPPQTVLDADDADRLAYVAEHPRQVDRAAVDALAGVLAASRRLEDAVGAPLVIEPVRGYLRLVERLTVDARGPLRSPVVSLAAQVAQFAAWLHTSVGNYDVARSLFDRATEWGLEVDDADMVSTALDLKGYIAWRVGQLGPMLGLSAAAGRTTGAGPGVRALAAQQQARAHALLGDGDATDRKLDEATELADRAAEHPDDEPPWIYFHSPDFLVMQRGRAYRYLGRFSQAAALLDAGLSALPAEIRAAEWAATYQADLDAVRAVL
jgi:transcriptional regulator with XRE-family HTH domain